MLSIMKIIPIAGHNDYVRDSSNYGFCDKRGDRENSTSEASPQLSQIRRNLSIDNCTCEGVDLDTEMQFGQFMVKVPDDSGPDKTCICKAFKLNEGEKFIPLRPNNPSVPFMFVCNSLFATKFTDDDWWTCTSEEEEEDVRQKLS